MMRYLIAAFLLVSCSKKEPSESTPTTAPKPTAGPTATTPAPSDPKPGAGGDLGQHQAGCDKGDAKACVELGLDYSAPRAGATKDPKKTEAALLKGCELGEGRACLFVAEDYRDGSFSAEMEPDMAKAVQFAKRGCEAGTLDACDMFAAFLRNGWGTERDLEKAHKIFLETCEKGLASSCMSLVDGYNKKIFKPIGDKDAEYYRRKACSLGAKNACKNP